MTAGQGFQIIGAVTNDEAGTSVAGAGDINSDGKDDLLVGAPWSDYGGRTDAGSVYVVWGKATGTADNLDNLDNQSGGGYRIGWATSET